MPAYAESSQFIDAVNQIRANLGVQTLQVDQQITGIALNWADSMATAGGISHRSDLSAGVTEDWLAIGENVGVGPTVTDLMNAFVASPGHYHTLIDPRFTHIGVGTVKTPDGTLYTAHEFMELASSAPAPTPTQHAATPTTARSVARVAPKVVAAAPRTTAAPTPTTVAPTTSTTAEPTTTTTLMSQQEKLQNSSGDDHHEQDHQSDGGCGPHQSSTLQAVHAKL